MQRESLEKETSVYRLLSAWVPVNGYVVDTIKNSDSLAIWIYAICGNHDINSDSIQERFVLSEARINKAFSHLEEIRLLRVTKTLQTGKGKKTELLFFEFPYEVAP